MITKEQITVGIQKGVIRFVVDPWMGNEEIGTVCQIGDCCFHFGGIEAESETPDDYVKNVPLEDIVCEVFGALEGFRLDEVNLDEYLYYEAVLNERGI